VGRRQDALVAVCLAKPSGTWPATACTHASWRGAAAARRPLPALATAPGTPYFPRTLTHGGPGAAAAGGAQQQQGDQEAALQSFERAAALGGVALSGSALGAASGAGPAAALGGDGPRSPAETAPPPGGAASAAPAPGSDPGEAPGSRAAARRLVARARLAQAGALRALGQPARAAAAEEEALALDPSALAPAAQLRQAHAPEGPLVPWPGAGGAQER